MNIKQMPNVQVWPFGRRKGGERGEEGSGSRIGKNKYEAALC
jgi:hypothetical protein